MSQMTRPRGLAILIAVALAFAGCSSGDDGETDTSDVAADSEVGADTAAPSNETTVDSDPAAPDDTAAVATLRLSSEPPAGAVVVVEAEGATDDRVVRRGAQSEIAQGQTFAVESDVALASVAFQVVAPEAMDEGRGVELALFEVGDSVTMVPSGPIPLDDTAGAELVLPLPDSLPSETPTHLVFSFPAVDLAAGQYAVALSLADGSSPAELYMQHAVGDELPDGVPIELTGTGWTADTVNGDSAISLVLSS
jgi:hypothetical protein